ncbi:hypothetical protein FRC19_004520 [Serendipita sp. 401]|nr:hypothetical protein FRC19_004520 [Serendipita sp. 401]KAG9028943.1 hypothetical protein FS842_004682 [Serendipita sp. 407]
MPGISIITALPHFVTQEEHRELTSSTPASFSELPAVLYHQESNSSITLDPPLDGFSTQDCSSGTAYVLSTVLIFWSATAGKGLQVTYPTISLHAISRAEFGPSIYCQLDETLDVDEEPSADEELELRELRINAQSEASRMYHTSCRYPNVLHYIQTRPEKKKTKKSSMTPSSTQMMWTIQSL